MDEEKRTLQAEEQPDEPPKVPGWVYLVLLLLLVVILLGVEAALNWLLPGR